VRLPSRCRGYRFLNLELDGTGSGEGVMVSNDIKDVFLCNLTIDGFALGVNVEGSRRTRSRCRPPIRDLPAHDDGDLRLRLSQVDRAGSRRQSRHSRLRRRQGQRRAPRPQRPDVAPRLADATPRAIATCSRARAVRDRNAALPRPRFQVDISVFRPPKKNRIVIEGIDAPTVAASDSQKKRVGLGAGDGAIQLGVKTRVR
jgi:hypothetical protein